MSESTLLHASLLAYFCATLAAGIDLAQPGAVSRRVASWSMALGFLLQALAIAARSREIGTIAVSSFAEQAAFFTWLVAGIYLAVARRYRLAVLGAVVATIAFVGALMALVDHGGVRDLSPGLRSPWLPVHVGLAFLGNAAFAFACLVSVIYLWQERKLKSHSLDPRMRGLPSLETLDQANFRCLIWGFVLLTLSILSGVLWAELSFGRFWSWEPRTLWTTVIWSLYALLLHGRVTVGWGGRRAAALTIMGFLVLLVSFSGVNVLAPGRHAGSFG